MTLFLSLYSTTSSGEEGDEDGCCSMIISHLDTSWTPEKSLSPFPANAPVLNRYFIVLILNFVSLLENVFSSQF